MSVLAVRPLIGLSNALPRALQAWGEAIARWASEAGIEAARQSRPYLPMIIPCALGYVKGSPNFGEIIFRVLKQDRAPPSPLAYPRR